MQTIDRYSHVLGFALEHPWAITPSMRATIAGIFARRLAGQEVDATEIAAAMVNRKNLPQPTKAGGAAIIPIYGVIAPRMNLFSEMSGGTTFESLSAQLAEAVDNPDVKKIVFDVDSPGGNVAGATEFAREVLKARTKKPIIAQINYLGASAAYWAIAGATEIVASQSAMVGSIGVYTLHDDISEALAKAGIKREVISAGKYKAEGADGGALSDGAKEHIKALIDQVYARMTTDIANGRGVKATAVRSGFGEGRTVSAEAALEGGLIDRIATMQETLARVAPTAHTTSARATDQERSIAATSQELGADSQWQNGALADLLSFDL